MLEMMNVKGFEVDARVMNALDGNGVRAGGVMVSNQYGIMIAWPDGVMVQLGVDGNHYPYWVAVNEDEGIVFQAGNEHFVQSVPNPGEGHDVISRMSAAMHIIDVVENGLGNVEDFRSFYGWLFSTLQ